MPSDYTASTAWPVIVSLHGNGRQGFDGVLPTGTDFAIRIRENGAPFPAIVVFPQARPGTRWFHPQMQRMVMAELDRTIAEFHVDPARVYLHGYSMGGGGAYRLAWKWPERFAAVVVVAGRVEPGDNYTAAEIELDDATNPAAGMPDPFAAFAAGLKTTPLWIFHGDADAVVPVDQSRRLVAALKSLGRAGAVHRAARRRPHGRSGAGVRRCRPVLLAPEPAGRALTARRGRAGDPI